MKLPFVVLAALVALPLPVFAQDDNDKDKAEKWDVAAPPLPTRDITIDVDEGPG